MEETRPIHIVILGASVAGLTMAHYIMRHISPKNLVPVKITIIAPSTAFYWTVGVPRAILNGNATPKPQDLFHDIPTALRKKYGEDKEGQWWEFVRGWATGFDPLDRTVRFDAILPEGGRRAQSLVYDHLVICSGTRNFNPHQPVPATATRADQLEHLAPFKPHGTEEETMQSLNKWALKIKNAEVIFLAGAGPTGIETSAEIAEYYPDKKVILASSSKTVLPMCTPSVSNAALGHLRDLGVDVRFNAKVERVQSAADGNGLEVILASGESVAADLYLPTFGQVPNTEFVPRELLDKDGYVTVTTRLNTPVHSNIWAVGDVAHWAGNRKAAPVIDEQCKIAAANIGRILHKGESGELEWAEYKHSQDLMMFLPMGKGRGTGQVMGWRVWSIIVRLVKGMSYMSWAVNGYLNGDGVAKKLQGQGAWA